MNIGDTVQIIDGSYCLGRINNKLEGLSGTALKDTDFVILATNCKLPADQSIVGDKKIFNDTVISAKDTERVVFIRERFLRFVRNGD